MAPTLLHLSTPVSLSFFRPKIKPHPRLFPFATDSNSDSDSSTSTPELDSGDSNSKSVPSTDYSDPFESRLSSVRLRYRSGTGKKAEIRKSRKSRGKGSGSGSGSGVFLPPVPLKEPESGGLKVEFGFSPNSEAVNGRIAGLGLAALLAVELATGKGVINYHSPAIVFIQERDMLTCHMRTRMWNVYSLGLRRPMRGTWQEIVSTSGLSHLPTLMFQYVNVPLICAFVERWQPETNSFHLPFGEMSILLYDVHCILGIPIEGRIVKVDRGFDREAIARALSYILFWDVSHTTEMLDRLKGLVKWEDMLSVVTSSEAVFPSLNGALIYLLVVLGNTLFIDKSQDKIDPMVVLLLDDFNEIPRYAWGAAALCYLYRQLGIATRHRTKQIADIFVESVM